EACPAARILENATTLRGTLEHTPLASSPPPREVRMLHSRLLFASIACLACLIAPAARAALPSPSTSTVDPCLRVCPAGGMTFHVVVRDYANNPQPGSLVVIDLCSCPGVVLCPLNGGEAYTIANGCIVRMQANGQGVADFQIRA